MSGPPFEVIVTLPGRTSTEVRAQLPKVVAAGGDVAEIRFDRWPEDEWTRAEELFPAPIPLLATYRSREEGGEGHDEEGERKARLRALDELPFRYLDLEPSRDRELVRLLTTRSRAPRPVLSTHLKAGWSPASVTAALASPAGEGSVVKVVVPASVTELYGSLRPLLPFPPGGPRRILLTTGSSGPVLRALSRRLGLAGVYAAPPTTDRRTAPASAPVEPSQIPVDALRAFFGAESSGRLFGLLGHPVIHSRSPRMHDGWYAIQKRPGLFVPIDVEPGEELTTVVDRLGRDGFDGFNVTHPWKVDALGCASNASPEARSAGCANTLTRQGDGWLADNFDVSALVRRGRELRSTGEWNGDTVLILGAGGAARAAVVAAQALGARASVLARDAVALNRLSRELGVGIARPGSGGSPVSLVVHATTAGMAGNVAPLELDWQDRLGEGTYVLDMVYCPENPQVKETAAARGARYEDGSRLLVYQAAECHRRWWGEPPGDALESWALEEVVCAA